MPAVAPRHRFTRGDTHFASTYNVVMNDVRVGEVERPDGEKTWRGTTIYGDFCMGATRREVADRIAWLAASRGAGS